MSNDFNFGNSSPNPYASPTAYSQTPAPNMPNTGKIVAPGIALIVVGVLGLGFSLFNVVFALTANPQIDPNAPEFVREMQANSAGPVAAGIQSLFVLVNLLVIVGGVQIMRISTWPLGLAAAIAAIINFGSCCCILGIPIGIWSIIILAQEDVRRLFDAKSKGM